MVRVKGSKLICLIMSVVLVCTSLCFPSFADVFVVDTGVSVTESMLSETTIERGREFKVNIETPYLDGNADSVCVKVTYDPKVLRFVKWDSGITGSLSEYVRAEYGTAGEYGDLRFFGIASAAGSGRQIPVDGGVTLTATMQVLNTARAHETYLDITDYTISYYPDGYDPADPNNDKHVDMWENSAAELNGTQNTNKRATIKLTGLPDETAVSGGISVTPNVLYNNEVADVDVEIPLIAWDSKDAYVRVRYDATRYDFESLDIEPDGLFADNQKYNYKEGNDGVFGINFTNPNSPELDYAISLHAKLRVKKDAPAGDTKFTLEWSIDDAEKPGNSLWLPEVTSVENVYVMGYPRFDGGISAPDKVKRGESIDVIVTVPAMIKPVESAAIAVQFDPSVFEVTKWEPVFNGANAVHDHDNAAGKFTLDISPSTTGGTFDIDGDVSFMATLTAKENCALGNTTISLEKYEIKLRDNGDGRSAWTPDSKSVIVNVYDPFQVPGGGIDLSTHEAISDQTFDLLVNIPVIYATTDAFTIQVKYDKDSFDLLSNETGRNGITVTANEGILTFKSSNGIVDLSAGLQLYAKMQVSMEATSGDHTFELTGNNVKSGSYALWSPDKKYDILKVTVTKKYPVEGGGITAPKTVKQGETFSVDVDVPIINGSADTVAIGIKYDPTVFEVLSWNPRLSGIDTTKYEIVTDKDIGYLSVIASRLDPKLDLSKKLTLSASVRAKSDAPKTTYTFELRDYVLSYIKSTGETVTLWKPDTTKADVKIVDEYEKYPLVSGNGISCSPVSIKSGENVTATVTVPAAAATNVNAVLTLGYDSTAFALVGTPTVSTTGFTASSGTGTYTFTGTGVDMSKGITFTATFKSIGSVYTTYPFSIDAYSFTNTESGTEQIWQPAKTKDYVTVSNGTSPVSGFPVSGGGLGLSKKSVTRGGTFNATITIPKINAIANQMSLMVEFDRSNFEVTSWEPKISGAYAMSGSGYFMLDMSGSSVDLAKGLTLTAKVKALRDADYDTYTFSLTSFDVKGNPIGVAGSQTLWSPIDRYQNIKVSSSSSTDPTPYPSGYSTNGGISLSTLYVNPGEMFTAYVTIPAIGAYAYDGQLMVQFDPNAFEVVSWVPYISGGTPSYGQGYFSLSLSSYSGLDLSHGIVLSAAIRAKSSIGYGRYSFVLSGGLRNGSQQVWYPTTTSAYVTVTNGYTNPGGYPYPWENTINPGGVIPPPNIYPPNNGGNGGNGGGNGGNNGGNGGNNGGNGGNGGGNGGSVTPAPDNRNVTPDDGGRYVTPEHKANITLKTDLTGINSGRVSAKTNAGFFSGDTIIYIRNTAEADSSAAKALRTLRLTGHRKYDFDISLYNTETGSYIHSLPNGGYIDFYFPVPNSMSPDSGDVAVYHILDGVPEEIDSVIVNDDGVRKIHFRANSFSPYMFVDLRYFDQVDTDVNVSDNTVVTPSNGNNGNNGGSRTPYIVPDSRGANPHTGLVGLLVVPAGAAVCLALARKNKKRKRSTRR